MVDLRCRTSIIIISVIILAASGGPRLLFLRGLSPPGADQAQRPVQIRGHDGNGIAGDPMDGDVLRQEVIFADHMLLRGVLLARLPQCRQPHLIKVIN